MHHLKKIAAILVGTTLFLNPTAVFSEAEFNPTDTPFGLSEIQMPSMIDVSSTYYRGDSVYAMIKGGMDLTPELVSTESTEVPSVIYVSADDPKEPAYFIAKDGLPTGETLDGRIAFDPSTGVLTLNQFSDYEGLVIANTDNVTLNLVGDNTMLPGGYIHCPYSANLAITGSGTLTFSQTDQSTLVDFFCIEAENLTIDGGTINVSGGTIKGTASTTINGGELNLSNPNGHCIVSQDAITVNSGTLNLKSGTTDTLFSALFCKTGSVFFAPDFGTGVDPTASAINKSKTAAKPAQNVR